MKLTVSNNVESLEEDIQRFQEHLQSEPEISSAFSGIINKMNEVISKCNQMMLRNDIGNKQLQEIRNEIASIRLHVHKCGILFEQTISNCVEAYRSAAGDRKEEFEKLSESEQTTELPQAYEALQRFHKLTRLKDLSQDISDELMNLSSEIEHQKLQQEESQPIEHFNVDSNAPTSPSLSP